MSKLGVLIKLNQTHLSLVYYSLLPPQSACSQAPHIVDCSNGRFAMRRNLDGG